MFIVKIIQALIRFWQIFQFYILLLQLNNIWCYIFILYISRLYHVIANHLPSAHGYADDTELYLSFRPNGRSSQDQDIASVEACILDVRAWLIHNHLLINDSKTEFLVVGSRLQLSKIAIDSITVGDSTIQPVKSVRNLGTFFFLYFIWVPGLTLICLCLFTLVRSAARLFMACIRFVNLGNSLILSPRRLLFTHLWLPIWTIVTLFFLASPSTR